VREAGPTPRNTGCCGIFRTEYEGATLRENLGLPRPENRFFAEAPAAAVG